MCQPHPKSELRCTQTPKLPVLERAGGQGKGQLGLPSQGRRNSVSAAQPGHKGLSGTALPSPVPAVHSGVPDDVLLVHTGVIALLALVGLAAHVVEHVLLREGEQGP